MSNPNYHKTTDKLATLNIAFETAATRASLAATAVLAQPVSSTQTPGRVHSRSQIAGSLLGTFKTVFLTWEASSGARVEHKVCRITAVDTMGQERNFSEEVRDDENNGIS